MQKWKTTYSSGGLRSDLNERHTDEASEGNIDSRKKPDSASGTSPKKSGNSSRRGRRKKPSSEAVAKSLRPVEVTDATQARAGESRRGTGVGGSTYF
jgi:hypothetical protein